MSDYLKAKENLVKAMEHDTKNTQEIAKALIELNEYIDKEKKDEKKIFKSFYRNVNYKAAQEMQKAEEGNDKHSNEVKVQLNDLEENQLGKAQVRMLNLIIELCYAQLNIYERQENEMEMKKMNEIIARAKNYLKEVERLSQLNFENPSEDLKQFALKENLDLNDPTVQSHFITMRKKYFEEIELFHKNNLLMMKEKNEDNKNALSTLKQLKKSKKAYQKDTNTVFDTAPLSEPLSQSQNGQASSKKKPRKKAPLPASNSNFNTRHFIIAFVMISSIVVFRYIAKALITNYYS